MELMKEWIKNIFFLIIVLSFVEILMPAGNMEKYIKYIFSVTILASILSPLVNLLT